MPESCVAPDDERFDWTLSLLTDPRFIHIRRRAEEYPLTWTDFRLMPQPPEVSPEQTWRLLTALRRQTAVMLLDADSEGRHGWYALTRSMRADLADIDRRCHKGSWLDSAIRSKTVTQYLLNAHVNGALTAIREDGVLLSRTRANEILFGVRTPRNPGEHLLLNCHRVMWRLDEYVDQECTPELITELHARIADQAPQSTAPLPRLKIGTWSDPAFSSPAEALEKVSAYVNGRNVDAADHPIAFSMGIITRFLNERPLPSWNGVMAALLCNLLFLKSDLPVVALIPILHLLRAWQEGALAPPVALTTTHDALVPIGEDLDFTFFDATFFRLIRLELDATEAAVRQSIERDEALSRLMLSAPGINYRQRAVLGAALDDPDATFRIDAHQGIHNVAYATARADLLGLAELGLLDNVRRGHAFVFKPVPGLRRRLRSVSQGGGSTAGSGAGSGAGEGVDAQGR